MKCLTTYQRLNLDAVCGETIIVTQRYTSFDVREIDILEERFKKTIGSGIMSEYAIKEQDK